MNADEALAELEARLWRLSGATRETAPFLVDSALRAAEAYAAECDVERLERAEAAHKTRQAQRRAELAGAAA